MSILWVQNAPKYRHNPLHEVIEYIDFPISCKLPRMDSLLTDEDIMIQRYKHTSTCYKKILFRHCRFGIPYPLMITTHIIEQLEFTVSTATNEEIAYKASLKETAKRIYKLIDEYDKGATNLDTISVLEYLNELNLTEEQYITC